MWNRKFGRTADHRKAMLRNLATSVILYGRVETTEAKAKDVLGRVYEYFLGKFALEEGKKGGQFYTPTCLVNLLVAMLEPYEGRVFDPCCGSGGMFVSSEKFINAHADRYRGKYSELENLFEKVVSIYGQESNQTTWRLCKMNLALRGIDSSNIRWNIFSNNRPSSYSHIISNSNSRHNTDISTNPNIISNFNRVSIFQSLISCFNINRMACCVYSHMWSN